MSNRFALRERTQDDHARLDALASQLDLTRDADYRAFLSWHAKLVPTLEHHLEDNGIAALLPDWPMRARRTALGRDLDAIGAPPPADAAALPAQADLATPEALWGIAYVVEGSRLGGKILRRQVGTRYRAHATHYLSHGQDEALWPSFATALDRVEWTPAQRDRAAYAAQTVFSLFATAFPFAPTQRQCELTG